MIEESQKTKLKILHKKITVDKVARNFFKKPYFFIGGSLVIILAVVLVTIFLILRKDSIATFLPASETQWLISYDDNKATDFYGIKRLNIEMEIENILNISFPDIKQWWAEEITIAGINIEDSVQTFLFLKIKNQGDTINFLKSLIIEGEDLQSEQIMGQEVFFFPLSRENYFLFKSGYLIIAPDKNTLLKYIDITSDQKSLLIYDPDFRKLQANLPHDPKLFVFVNWEKIKDLGYMDSQYNYLTKIFNKSGLAVEVINDGIKFNVLTLVNKNYLPNPDSLVFSNKFTEEFSHFIPVADTAVYFGGTNLKHFYDTHLELLENYNPAFKIIIDSLINQNLSKIIGDDFKVEQFLALLENEYAFVVSLLDNQPHFSLIIQSNDLDNDKILLANLQKAYRNQSRYLSPQIIERSLPDGTITKELSSDTTNIKLSEHEIDGLTVYSLDIDGYPFGFHYAIKDTNIFISSNVEVLKSLIETSQGKKLSLAKSAQFNKGTKAIHLLGDELSYIDLRFIKLFLNSENIYWDLDKLESIFWRSKIFNDGLAMDGVITHQ